MKALLIAIAVLCGGCEYKRMPTCEERGGRTVTYTGLWWTGKSYMMLPRTRCEGAAR